MYVEQQFDIDIKYTQIQGSLIFVEEISFDCVKNKLNRVFAKQTDST